MNNKKYGNPCNYNKLYIQLVFIFSSLICSAELPPYLEGENLERLLLESSDIVMVCVYQKTWIPPVRKVSKGQLNHSSRIVSVLKGNRKIGDKILAKYSIEGAPSWLTEFQSTVDGELKYIFFAKDDLIKRDDGSYYFNSFNLPGFDFYDGSLTFLNEKIRSAGKIPVR